MQNFTFHNPTRILFGKGRIADIAREIPAGARVLITYGGGSVVSTGTLDEVTAALKGFTLFEFAGIEPNPTYETLMQAVDLARREKIDFLLAEQNTNMALRYADFGYILENGRVVMEGAARDLAANEDVKEFYLGLSSVGRKSFRDVKHYRRRKRWLS